MSVALSSELQKVITACHHDPFSILGKHQDENGIVVRTHIPHAVEVMIAEGENVMQRVPDTAVFEWRGAADALSAAISIGPSRRKQYFVTPIRFRF